MHAQWSLCRNGCEPISAAIRRSVNDNSASCEKGKREEELRKLIHEFEEDGKALKSKVN